jgi:hypothetical protein
MDALAAFANDPKWIRSGVDENKIGASTKTYTNSIKLIHYVSI